MTSCGPGITNEDVLKYLRLQFEALYYVYTLNEEIAPCFENLLYISPTNMAYIINEGYTLLLTAFAITTTSLLVV